MSEPNKIVKLRPEHPADDRMLVQLTVGELRQIIAEEVKALQNGYVTEKDRLLTPEEAAEIIGESPRWLYRHSKQLPFARKLSRKSLRFSENGLRRWIAARRS